MFIRDVSALFRLRYYKSCLKRYSTTIKETNVLRNIGILAHIDAGKTTTTERMLYFSGTISRMGEVHHGNTVTDYMDQERERGITITSAAVTFEWKRAQFNLIDTPGHIDFTMEVEQTLNVLDGAIVVLDASAGVEAQTLTVWRQANKYKIPRIMFANKMDKGSASLEMCCDSVWNKLNVPPICLQMPIKTNGAFVGTVDVLTFERSIFNERGLIVRKAAVRRDEEPDLWNEVLEKRIAVVDKISEYDDALAEKIIVSNSLQNIETDCIVAALRRATLKRKVVPILCGSSYKNVGVQSLMDAIILYLPSPSESKQHFNCFEESLCARAFKVIHNRQKGPLVFFRTYSGRFEKAQRIYNVQKDLTESSGRLLVAYADEFKEVDNVPNGNIAVVTGLKHTTCGDLVTTSSTAASQAKKRMLKLVERSKHMTDAEVERLFNAGTDIPEPVFFCSIEPPSLAFQSALEQALIELQREDPSLRVTFNADTGQTVLAGMGELHLDIIKNRIVREYKIEADLGPLQIAYKEMPNGSGKLNHLVDTKIGNSKHSVYVVLSVLTSTEKDKDVLKLDKTPDAASNLAKMRPKHLLAVKQGIEVAFSHGPKIGCSLINMTVMLHMLEVGRGTSETIIAAAVTQCIQKILTTSGTSILEPIMSLEIVTTDEYLTSILADISRRRATILNIDNRGGSRVLQTQTPLAELLGYATALRTISSGTASFSMEFLTYKKLSSAEETVAIQNIRGF